MSSSRIDELIRTLGKLSEASDDANLYQLSLILGINPNIDFKGLCFSSLDLSGVDFRGINLSDCDLRDTKFEYSLFDESTITIDAIFDGGKARPKCKLNSSKFGEKNINPNNTRYLSNFVGRNMEIDYIINSISNKKSVLIAGIGGVGKTLLANIASKKLETSFSSGIFIVNLGDDREKKSPMMVMEDVIRRFYPEVKIPDDDTSILGLYRSILRERHVLLILDNAADAAQVRNLLPPQPSMAIVTSRTAIRLDGLAQLGLGNLPPAEAKALIATIVGTARSLTEADRTAVAEACRCHPLALRVAATFLRDHRATPVETYVARITERRDKLKLDGDPESDVMAVLGLSVDNLEKADPDLARRWRDLAVFPSDFGFEAAAMLWGDADADAALERLEWLETLGLVEAAGDGRHRLHDLLRDVARLRSPPPEIAAARLRHAQVYCAILGEVDELYLAGGATRIGEALALFDRERANILAGRAVAASRAAVDDEAAALVAAYANAGAYVTDLRLHPRERIDWWQDALGGSRKIGDRRGEGSALGNLGTAFAALGETKTAIEHYERHLAIAHEIGDRRGEGNALGNLGLAYAALGMTQTAIEHYGRHLAIAHEIGDRQAEGNALGGLGTAFAALSETRTAIEYYERHLAIAREIGDRRGEGDALGNLGLAYAALGMTQTAIEHYVRHLAITREIGDRRGEGNALGNLGLAYAALGETKTAIEHYERHLAIAREIGDRRGEGNALYNWAAEVMKTDPALAQRLAGEALALYETISSPNAVDARALLERLSR